MPGRSYSELARQLQDAGLSPQTPCAAVSHAGRPTQQVRWCDLSSLERAESLPPTILIVGECANPIHIAEHFIHGESLVDESQTETMARQV
jgi:siroheme synthase